MSVFGAYADYYDALYRDKDYGAEAAFVHRLLKRHAPQARSLFEIGSGTGRHAIELVRRGYHLEGVDLSARMVAHARAAIRRLPAGLRGHAEIRQGDVTKLVPQRKFDSVISLFHVVNYQITDRALSGMFRAARAALAPGGVFVFDFWYAPAVHAERPTTRVRRAVAPGVRLIRLSEPAFDGARNVIDVDFTLFVTHTRSGHVKVLKEQHTMRALFLPELKRFARMAHFEFVDAGQWLTGKALSSRTWIGYAVLRAAGKR